MEDNGYSAIVIGSICFFILLRILVGSWFHWTVDDEKDRRRIEHGAIMAVLIVIMYSLLVIIDKL